MGETTRALIDLRSEILRRHGSAGVRVVDVHVIPGISALQALAAAPWSCYAASASRC